MNKKLLFSIIAMALISVSPFMSTIAYPTGTLLYSDDVVPNAEFKWTIEELSADGVYYTTDYNFFDQIELTEGDEIKLLVQLDPDTVTDPILNLTWYDLYVNDVQVNDPTNVSLGYSFYFMIPWGDFITPVQYDNGTVYDMYETLYYEEGDFGGLVDFDYTFIYSDISTEYGYGYEMGMSLEDDVFTLYFWIEAREIYVNPEDDDEMRECMSFSSVTSIDINTGVVLELRNFIDFENYVKTDGNVTDDESGHYHFQMLAEGYDPDPSPFNILFSILGLSAFGVMVFSIRKRRK